LLISIANVTYRVATCKMLFKSEQSIYFRESARICQYRFLDSSPYESRYSDKKNIAPL